jgi:hypothetical protein
MYPLTFYVDLMLFLWFKISLILSFHIVKERQQINSVI